MSDSTTIRVLVADDHDLLREGVASSLAAFADIDVVADAASGELAIERVAESRPDVVVIDLVMPGMGGVEAIRRLRAGDAALGIVALSSFSEGDRVREVVDAGANGYLVKSVDAASLARAVRSAAAGQSSFSPEAMTALTEVPAVNLLTALTSREQEIIALIAEGRTNAEIADRLALSIFTVKNHVSSILMKLQVQTRTEAAAVVFRSQTDRPGR
ncbi:MAG: response regulator transcription factor [Acidimicrobiia bacterium]|nr:response regulator transcription factor [Acidimicrobiia bacterium]